MHIKTDLYTHIMKYMGSKRELLSEIRKIINTEYSGEGAILDLFSGTCGVGMALRDIAPIYSNDIQAYSAVIAEGCLGVSVDPLDKIDIQSLLEKNFEKNFAALEPLVKSQLLKSKGYISNVSWNEKNRAEYIAFMDNISSHVLKNGTHDTELSALRDLYQERTSNKKLFPYMQTTYLFSEMYFSTEQAMVIDSLAYSISKLRPPHSELKHTLLTALIHAYSYTSAGTGHFAQFRDMSTLSSIKDVFHYRKLSVMDYFLRKAEEIIKTSSKNKYADTNSSFHKDFKDILSDNTIMDKVGMVYADPPYSFVHYSRFYHAIENLARYDYPTVEHKGRYRGDRHQSPFCIKTKAPGGFEDMFTLTHRFNKPVLVSYSNTGMISLEKLIDIAQGVGYKVTALEIDHKHSTMGRLKDKSRDVKEALILCSIN